MQRLIEKDLLEWKNKEDRKPLILYGARQVGKSYTLLEFGKKNYANVAYCHFENNKELQAIFDKGINEVKPIFTEISQLIKQPILPKSTLVIFDEIQACPAAVTALKRIYEDTPEYHVVAAGSLLGLMLYRDARYSYPVGKVDILRMYPMNFCEFLMATAISDPTADINAIQKCYDNNLPMSSTTHNYLLEKYATYLAVGGMPECVKEYIGRKDMVFVKARQLGICDTYTNDMVKYCSKTEAIKNTATYNCIPAQLAKENKKFQYALIKSGAKSKDFYDALFWCEKANIIIRVSKTNEGKMPLAGYEDLLSYKIYFSDVGLLSAKSNIDTDALLIGTYGGEMKGAITENFVAQELVANGIRPFYWESKGTAELDFVIQQGGKIVPIETKANLSTKAKSLDTFCKKYKIDFSIRVSAKNFGFENGIKSVPHYAIWCIKP